MHRSQRPKRLRALQACEVCRARKNRCDEEQPCSYCLERDLECVYSRTRRETRRAVQSAKPSRGALQESIQSPPCIIGNPRSPETDSGAVNGTILHESREPAMIDPVSVITNSAQGRVQSPAGSSSTRTPVRRNHLEAQHSTDTVSEVLDTNIHTQSLEFYGASSSVAFLRHVHDISGNATGEQPVGMMTDPLPASMLQSLNFQPYSTPTTASEISGGCQDRFYFRAGRKFVDAYFNNIHCIQPIFDQEEFLTRCEDLWLGRLDRQPASFVALYYATLSLGSLVMVWDEEQLYGEDRFTWSRKLFNQAQVIMTQLGSGTNLEMVQCYYMMGKVCQHELNPHVAYLYSGQATRAALATGLNRLPPAKCSDPRSSIAAAKTWWAVYCLDIQTSFALGRPDSLGPDEYHTQDIPGASAEICNSGLSVLQFVPYMVKLSRIMRSVSLRLYSRPCPLREDLSRAKELDARLDYWFQTVPSHLKSDDATIQSPPLKRTGAASYIKKQSAVLMMRYYNLRMIIFGKFLTVANATEADMAAISACQEKCIGSASQTIDHVYDIYRNHEFFQTWWYNSTYVLFAVSVLLTGIFHGIASDTTALNVLFEKVDRAISILDVMNDCAVTRNAILIIKRTLARAKRISQGDHHTQQMSPSGYRSQQNDQLGSQSLSDPATDLSQINWTDVELSMDDSQQALFWVEWGHLLNDLNV